MILRPHHWPGFTLIETMMSTILAGILMVAALSTVSAVHWTEYSNTTASRGMALAQALLAEIEPLAYEDPVTPGGLGLENDESTEVRAQLNDVDDYDGLQLDPITDINGVTIVGTTDWTLEVSVQWATISTPQTTTDSDTGLKLITIQAAYQDRIYTTLQALKADLEP